MTDSQHHDQEQDDAEQWHAHELTQLQRLDLHPLATDPAYRDWAERYDHETRKRQENDDEIPR